MILKTAYEKVIFILILLIKRALANTYLVNQIYYTNRIYFLCFKKFQQSRFNIILYFHCLLQYENRRAETIRVGERPAFVVDTQILTGRI